MLENASVVFGHANQALRVNTMSIGPQERVLEFMARSDSYSCKGVSCIKLPSDQKVEIITTHCAYIFMYGNDVYKIKRAVSYTYLDMSTLETRHSLCQREIELNQAVLPDIYIGVVPITSTNEGTLEIDGQGVPVEWAVHMTRFSQACVLDEIAESGKLDTALASDIGQSVATYHAHVPAAPVKDGYQRIAEVVEELVVELRLFNTAFPSHLLKQFETNTRAELADCQWMLDQRASAGWVKRCHGDLHLRNLVLHHHKPTPFDALEFNERLATTDVLYDVAFLIMDMMHRGLLIQANSTLNQYLLHSADTHLAGLRLMSLFLSCRAAIRAMTTAQASLRDGLITTAPRSEATAYLELALQCLERKGPTLIGIGGLSGTGKSTLARYLAPTLGPLPGAVVLRSDAERKVSVGVDENKRLSDSHYSTATSRSNYHLLLHKAAMSLDAGYSVIVDAVFIDSEYRYALEQCAAMRKCPFAGLWLEAPVDVMQHRINSRVNDASDATTAVLDKQLHLAKGEITWQSVDASGLPEKVLDLATRAIRSQATSEAQT